MKPLVVYGNGAMAEVFHSFAATDLAIAGFVVDEICIPAGERTFCDLPLVPYSQVKQVFPPSRFRAIVAIGWAEMNELRRQRHDGLSAMGYELASYVHPSVVRHRNVVIEDGCIVYDNVALHPGTIVRRGAFISSNASIGHHCLIGDFSWINSGVSVAGHVAIGPGCFFGVNAAVADGVHLGARSYVGAATLVARDCSADSVMISPAGEKFPATSATFLKFIGRSKRIQRRFFR